MPSSLAALGVYALCVVGALAGMVVVSYFLGERHSERGTNVPFEGGMLPTGGARIPLTPQFYVVAVLFVVFDLEAVFLFAWAVAAREVGWTGFGEMLVFVIVLLVGLAWLWRVGALDPTPARERR